MASTALMVFSRSFGNIAVSFLSVRFANSLVMDTKTSGSTSIVRSELSVFREAAKIALM